VEVLTNAVVVLRVSGVEVQTITTNTEGQLIVVTERAGSINICPVVCHGSCDGCAGNGAEECSDLTHFVPLTMERASLFVRTESIVRTERLCSRWQLASTG
jgi:hypothetical protein